MLNNKLYNNNLSYLENMNSKDLSSRFTAGSRRNKRNKLHSTRKSNHAAMFYPKTDSCREG